MNIMLAFIWNKQLAVTTFLTNNMNKTKLALFYVLTIFFWFIDLFIKIWFQVLFLVLTTDFVLLINWINVYFSSSESSDNNSQLLITISHLSSCIECGRNFKDLLTFTFMFQKIWSGRSAEQIIHQTVSDYSLNILSWKQQQQQHESHAWINNNIGE